MKTEESFFQHIEKGKPAAPDAGFRAFYAKSDGFYMLDSSNLESKLGNGIYGSSSSTIGNHTATIATNKLIFASTDDSNLLSLNGNTSTIGIGVNPSGDVKLFVKGKSGVGRIFRAQKSNGDTVFEINNVTGSSTFTKSDIHTITLNGGFQMDITPGDGVRIKPTTSSKGLSIKQPTSGSNAMTYTSVGDNIVYRLIKSGGVKKVEWDTNAEKYGISESLTVGYAVGTTARSKMDVNGDLGIVDGMTPPSATVGRAKIYVDSADGDLKIIFGNGFIVTLATDS